MDFKFPPMGYRRVQAVGTIEEAGYESRERGTEEGFWREKRKTRIWLPIGAYECVHMFLACVEKATYMSL